MSDKSATTPNGAQSRKQMATISTLSIAAISLALCVLSPLANSLAFLFVPLLGIVTVCLGICARSWWMCLVGVVEIISPAFTIYLTYYALSLGA